MRSAANMVQTDHLIQTVYASAQKLLSPGEDFPAISRNPSRILADQNMVEINICDAADLPAEGGAQHRQGVGIA